MEREYIRASNLYFTAMSKPPLPITPGSSILALDTGSPWVSVALAHAAGPNGEIAAVRAAIMERSSNQVLEMMRAVLVETGVRQAELGGIVALLGPGSFTGVRIGLATALGFHQALGIPATGLSTFEALAVAADAPHGAVTLAAVDALRGDWSVQAFAAGPSLTPLGAPEIIPSGQIPALFDRLGAPPEGRVVAGFDLGRLAVLPDWPAKIRLFTPDPQRPLAAVAALRAIDPSLAWDPGSLVAPLYSRPPAVTLPRPRVLSPNKP
jgi:tRNA threonylcarbamoyl adenosine modification protein YeaZ